MMNNIIDKIDKLVIESTYGKQKSKDWFKFRGQIVGTKSKQELSALMKQMEKSFRNSKGGLTEFEMADLVNQSIEKLKRL